MQDVVLLNSVLEEEGESLDAVCNILLNQKVHDVVECASSVVGVVNGIATHIAGAHVARNMEVDGVATNPEGLTHVCELSVFNPGLNNKLVLVLGADDDDGSHLVTAKLLSKLAGKAGLGGITESHARVKVLLAGGDDLQELLVEVASDEDVPCQQADFSS